MKASMAPDWKGEEVSLNFIIPQKSTLDDLMLRVECYDWEERHDDRFIGSGEVSLNTVFQMQGQGNSTTETVALFQKTTKKNKKPKAAGTVDIELWVHIEGSE